MKWKSTTIIALLLILYAITRVYNLLLLPLFTDESIYIYWAKIIATTHSQYFISLTDGKPPLLIWTIAVLISIFPHDWYLLAGRIPSVVAGAISTVGIYFLAKELFKSTKVAIVSSLLYIFNPFTLFYDRMALFDSPLQAMSIVSVYFGLRTIHKPTLKHAILWGVFLGLAMLSKPTALLFLGLSPVASFLVADYKKLIKEWKDYFGFTLFAVVLGYGINSLQRISSVYPAMEAKNAQFQQPLSELIKNPLALTGDNLRTFFDWLFGYYGWPLLALGIVSFIILLIVRRKQGAVLVLLWFGSLFALATVGKEVFPRYILFSTPFFLVAVAWLISYIWDIKHWGKYLALVVGAGSLTLPFITIFHLETNPPEASIPYTEYTQYISEHPSGYGLDKTYAVIDHYAKEGKVILFTQGTFGLYPYAYTLRYWGNPNVQIEPRWPLDKITPEVTEATKNGKVLIVLKEYDQVPQSFPVTVLAKGEKPGGRYPIYITTLK